MARRVVLHVGLMKSGTSYLQQRLFANRDALDRRRVLLPGERWRDQVLAVSDVLERPAAGGVAAGRWAALVRDAAAYDGDVLVSMEFLGPAPPERIATVLSAFAEPVEVTAVVTLRDLGRGVPAMWQESLQNGGRLSWAEYLAQLADGGPAAKAFWRQQGMGRIVDNWVDAVGADRVRLVTVPPPGSPGGLLWERFCTAAGIDGSGCAEVAPANTSLDAASAVVLLELNRRLADADLTAGDRRTLVKFGLAKTVLGRRHGDAIGFDPPPWLLERAASIEERLRAGGARVVGSLDDLAPRRVPGTDPGQVPAEQTLDAALEALSAMTVRAGAERRRAQSGSTTTSETP